MYLMYVDESGDPGLNGSPSRYYILCGLVMHELRWRQYLDQLIVFRRRMKTMYGLRVRDEIHARHFLSNPGHLATIPLHQRASILRAFTSELGGMADLSIVNVVVDKQGKAPGFDPYIWAWKLLLQRLENGVSNRNFNGPTNADERGLVLPDLPDTGKLRGILRQLRRFNIVPHRGNAPLQFIVEDPCFRDSAATYFIQAADLISYSLCQKLLPNRRAKRHGVHQLFDRLNAILYLQASNNDPQGIVRF